MITELREFVAEAAQRPGGVVEGREFCATLAERTDDWLIGLFDAALAAHRSKANVALLAVGGYGRGELAPYSDLDLLLVHDAKPRKVAEQIEPIASAIWYPVWDAGAKLGHAVRRVDEQLALVTDDLDSATALVTARHLAGDESLAREVIDRGLRQWRADRGVGLEALLARVRERQRSAGDVAYLLEPDLKSGHGGLRDVQSLWWAQAAGLSIRAEDLLALDDCYEVLLRARVALHLASGRGDEVLRLDEQDRAAEVGGWSDADELMADVAAAGRTVAWLCDENWGRAVEEPSPPDRAVAPGIVLRDGEIALADTAVRPVNGQLALHAAVAAARTGRRIARSTLDTFADDVEPWPGAWPAGASDDLVALLLEGEAAIPPLEALDQHDLLARLMPEWAPVRSRPQRNAYHRFTVDRHLWQAAANAAGLVERVHRPDLLVLAALFHDLGKGYPGDHTEVGMELVRTIAPRLGLGVDDVETLVAMVEHHLLLPDVAMRRDLADPATVELIASLVRDPERLALLHALTEADSKATGPSAWGAWKAGLVGELVERTRHVLGGGDVEELTWRLFPDEETLAAMAAGSTEVWREGDAITVVSPDSAGTFSQFAGVLALHGLDVVSAQAHSEHGVAASRYMVVPPSDAFDWDRLESDLLRALDHRLAIEARLAERATTYRRRRRTQASQPGPPQLKFIENASSDATVIEVRAPTKTGVLHRITKAFAELGLDIRHATVQTIGMEVVDTFYVRTFDGGLVVDEAHRGEIERAVLHAVRSAGATVGQ